MVGRISFVSMNTMIIVGNVRVVQIFLFFVGMLMRKLQNFSCFLQACWLTQNWENLNEDGLSLFKTVEQTLSGSWLSASPHG